MRQASGIATAPRASRKRPRLVDASTGPQGPAGHLAIGLKPAAVVAVAYFLAVFALGFALGSVRMLLVAPLVGDLAATLAEAPVMLIAAASIWGWIVRRGLAPRMITTRWVVVAVFLTLLIACETLLGAILFGRTPARQWEALMTPAGAVGLSAQVVAALFPVLLRPLTRKKSAGRPTKTGL